MVNMLTYAHIGTIRQEKKIIVLLQRNTMECHFSYTYPFPKSSVIHGLLMMRVENQEADFHFKEIGKENGAIKYQIVHKVHPLLVPMLGSQILVYETIDLFFQANQIKIDTHSDIKAIGNFNPSITSTSTITEQPNGTCILKTTLVAQVSKVPSFLERKIKQTLEKRYIELRQKEQSFMT